MRGWLQPHKNRRTIEARLRRSLRAHAASLIKDEPLDADAEIACRMAKAQASEALKFAGDRAVQFHGGMGYMRETPVERMSRDARVQAIGGGASEVMLEEVAKRM